MKSILHVLSVNEVREGAQGDRKWQSQDVEAVTRDEDGSFGKAGRLRLPKDLIGRVSTGIFMGSFALDRDDSKEGGGRLVPKLVGLQPYTLKGAQPGEVKPAPAAPAVPK